MIGENAPVWRINAALALTAFVMTVVGGSLVCAFWLRDLGEPSVTFLGSGSNLSVLVSDGPARFLLATGDDPIGFENAFLATQPLFARRVDLLLVAGDAASLRVPEAARRAANPRHIAAIGALPLSPERDALLPIETMSGRRHIRLGSGLSIRVETRLPIAADALESAEAWRLTIDHRSAQIVIYSDGDAVPLFPPAGPASIVAVAGSEPVVFMPAGDGAVFVANATQIGGPELREATSADESGMAWTVRVHPGDAVRLLLTTDGVDVPSWAAVPVQAST